jgi:hypothetical protein
MKDEIFNQASRTQTSESNLLGLPRPWAGAVIGILLFTAILVILQVKESFFFEVLLFPGNWVLGTVRLSENVFNLSDFVYDVLTFSFVYIFSCIPPAILGSLIISRNKVIREFGFALLGVCLLILLGYGLLLLAYTRIGD